MAVNKPCVIFSASDIGGEVGANAGGCTLDAWEACGHNASLFMGALGGPKYFRTGIAQISLGDGENCQLGSTGIGIGTTPGTLVRIADNATYSGIYELLTVVNDGAVTINLPLPPGSPSQDVSCYVGGAFAGLQNALDADASDASVGSRIIKYRDADNLLQIANASLDIDAGSAALGGYFKTIEACDEDFEPLAVGSYCTVERTGDGGYVIKLGNSNLRVSGFHAKGFGTANGNYGFGFAAGGTWHNLCLENCKTSNCYVGVYDVLGSVACKGLALYNCRIEAGSYGILVYSGSYIDHIVNCYISAGVTGVAVYVATHCPTFTRCIFVAYDANCQAASVATNGGRIHFEGCTFYGHKSFAIENKSTAGGTTVVRNCIFWLATASENTFQGSNQGNIVDAGYNFTNATVPVTTSAGTINRGFDHPASRSGLTVDPFVNAAGEDFRIKPAMLRDFAGSECRGVWQAAGAVPHFKYGQIIG